MQHVACALLGLTCLRHTHTQPHTTAGSTAAKVASLEGILEGVKGKLQALEGSLLQQLQAQVQRMQVAAEEAGLRPSAAATAAVGLAVASAEV